MARYVRIAPVARPVPKPEPLAKSEPPAKAVAKPAAPEVDLGSLRKDDLVNLAAAQGVDTSGTKAEIIERLES
jgi:hypothetical protein